ncbi:MAG: hypothetical protein MMC23_005365 [Stictis urceolatum]|nr:hypothetical protein [Stictis urceolata]
MGAPAVIVTTIVAALGGLLFQPVKELAFTSLGVARRVQPISDFPYTCRKLEHPQLQACEDLYIDEKGRDLYLACSAPLNRKHWQPAVDRLNRTGRAKTDHFSVLDLDEPGKDGLFGLRTLKTSGYAGTNGDGVLDLHGFDAEAIGGSKLRFWVVNHRPPLDLTTGKEIDAFKTGLNSTIEVFELPRSGDTLEHKYTYAHPQIRTPNRLAATGENGFVMTNDKSVKVGFRRELDLLIGGGNLVHCEAGRCQPGISGTLKFPNGITRSHKDGLYYVPSSADGTVTVFTQMPQGTLAQVDKIFVGQPMDNLAVDKNGDVWAAAFPKVLQLFSGFEDPFDTRTPSAAFRIRKVGEGYEVEKAIEDRDGEVLPAATSVVHDATTGRLFFGGVFSPFVTVCDPKR